MNAKLLIGMNDEQRTLFLARAGISPEDSNRSLERQMVCNMGAKLLERWYDDVEPHLGDCDCEECGFRFGMNYEQRTLFLARAGISPEDSNRSLERQMALVRAKIEATR